MHTRVSLGSWAAVTLVAFAAVAAHASAAAAPGRVDVQRLLNGAAEPGQWLAKGGDWRGSFHSPLADIDATNVQRLGLAWSYDAMPRRGRMGRGLAATPVVVDGVVYTSLAWAEVVALDARTGRELWRHDPQSDGSADRKACCDVVNRGVAVFRGRVYVGTTDGFLEALDAKSGRRVWRSDTFVDRVRSYTITGAPQVAGDVVVIGNGGGEFGVRGYVSAYDLRTGTLRWRFWIVPGDPKLGFEHPEMAAAARTWDPNSRWEFGGGGTAWDAFGYDPKLNLLYVGTGNSTPYPSWIRSPSGGDNLYLASILAIDPSTGRLKWHYQTTPGENWDYTATQPFILADLALGGRTRQVLMQAPKNGFFYVLDRATGELLSAEKYVYVNWAERVDLQTGRPVVTGKGWYKDKPKLVYPSQTGGHNWMPMSYSPRTGLVYIPVIESAMLFTALPDTPFDIGTFNVGAIGQFPPVTAEQADGEPQLPVSERLVAWDPVKQQEVWRVPVGGFWNGGVLSTGGDLVFQGTSGGDLVVYEARTGRELKRIRVGTGIMAAPATYRIGGEQYVIVLAGYGGAMQKAFFPGIAAREYQNQPRILAFKLGGGDVPLPPKYERAPLPAEPYAVTASAAEVERGKGAFMLHCARCHGGIWDDVPSGYPDLKRMPPTVHAAFESIVLDGALAYSGMASFRDVLTPADAREIQAWLQSETNAQIAAAKRAQ